MEQNRALPKESRASVDVSHLPDLRFPEQSRELCGDCAPNRELLANNLGLSNKEMSTRFGIKRPDHWLARYGLKRTPEQRKAISTRQNAGAANPRWLGGIAENHYHWKKLQRQRYPERVNAREAVRRAVRSGKLIPLPCQHPGCTETKTFAHHEDYSKPLDVAWFCKPHHDIADRIRKAA